MKIVVLAGGLSTERQVSLTSGTGVCRALRERGHQAILVDMFLGLEDYNGSLSDIFEVLMKRGLTFQKTIKMTHSPLPRRFHSV